MSDMMNFPRQMLPESKKTESWRRKCVLWGDSKTFFNYSLVRKSVLHKKINYDLMNGKLHMQDMQLILNPDNIQANYIPDHLQHYPIMSSKINVLKGEALKRPFDYKVVVTNPTAVSEIEEDKKRDLMEKLQAFMQDDQLDENQQKEQLDKLNDYYTYEWQDMREIRANQLLNHYIKEYNMPLLFADGFMDAMICGEEIYQCDIIGGEPAIRRLNPLKIRIFKSGYSNKIEDADVIILEDYWNPGRVIDTFYDVLKPKDIKYLQEIPDNVGQASTDSMANIDERYGFVNQHMIGEEFSYDNDFFFDPAGVHGMTFSLLPYDMAGNVRVMQMYWKSLRKILKVKQYDQETGEETFDFFPEDYKPDEALGEEIVGTFWINEAWEGTLIGGRPRNNNDEKESDDDSSLGIFVNIRPRPVQYNRLSNPSACHFGIVGSIYNLNDDKPFSLVDMMKPYNYLYDAIHYRLNDAIAANWGEILEMDFAKIPKGWDIDKWMYYAKINHIAVVDSFKEGNIGASTGKLAGGMNNASKGMLSTNAGNYIQQLTNLLEYIKTEMSEVIGVSKQREGQISNRETVGGVERATLQSSYITEWLFATHDDVKKRAMECFLETAKIAMKGKSKKFQYITSDMSQKIIDIDGDEFAECDYGLILDSSNYTTELNQKLDTLAQAAMQNQTVDFSAIMKLWSTASLAEKQRIIERSEQKKQEQAQQEMQAQQQMQQQQIQAQQQQVQKQLDMQYKMHSEDNETKVLVAQIQAQTQSDVASLKLQSGMNDGISEPMSEADKAKLQEQIREFDAKLQQDYDKIELQRQKNQTNAALKKQQINKQRASSTAK